MYTPFLQPTRMKELDGYYFCLETHGVCKFDKVVLKGFIDCEDCEKPYDGYWVKYTDSKGAFHGRCIISVESFNSDYRKATVEEINGKSK